MVLVFLVGSFFSCNEKIEKPNEFPVEIFSTEISLADTSCQWTNLDFDGKLIVINSNEELENYISCSDESHLGIDFSKYTLLIASGNAGHVVHSITKRLQQLSANKYKLDIEIIPSDAPVALPTTWSVALITSKISENCQIKLNATIFKDY